MNSPLHPGHVVLGRYQVLELIAWGGQAAVYKGRDTQTGGLVAIKQLGFSTTDAGADQLRWFQREGNHPVINPHIPKPLACAEENGAWYIILPFIEGLTLADYVRQMGGKLPLNVVLAILDQVIDALIALHAAGFVHRDLKPENLMIEQTGHLWVIDLGVAKDLNSVTVTQIGGGPGTPPWMSPEQVDGSQPLDHRSDLYTLGMIFYWLLTGQMAVQGQDSVAPTPRQLDASIPPHVDLACMRLLEKDPGARFQSAAEIRQALGGQATPAARFCHACGVSTGDQARFCHACGADLRPVAQTTIICAACGAPADPGPACPGCHRTFSGSNHRLCCLSGTTAGRTFRIPEGIFLVGRLQLSPRDSHISKNQLFIAAINGTVYLQDAGSTNKTLVAGQPAEGPVLLRPGIEIVIAGNTAVYQRN